MQDTGSLAFVTLPDCACAILYISVSSTSHLRKKYFHATGLVSEGLLVFGFDFFSPGCFDLILFYFLSSHNSKHCLE